MFKEYRYSINYSEDILDYLTERNIAFNVIKVMDKIPTWIYFELYSNMENCEIIIQELEDKGMKYSYSHTTYSETEITQADFMIIIPHKQSIDILNEDAFAYLCEWKNQKGDTFYRHEVQINDLIVRKEPSTKKRTAFWFESTGWCQMFADFRVKRMVNSNGLKGIIFKDIYLKNGKKSEFLYQIEVPKRLTEDDFVFGYGEKIDYCPNCGKAQYILKGDHQIHLNATKIDLSKDLFISEIIFGEGKGFPQYIISQRFYQLLKKYNLCGGLTFEPVILEYK